MPTDLIPTNYRIQLFLNQIKESVYDGFNEITFTVNKPTNWLIVHNSIGEHNEHNVYPSITQFVDINGDEVNVSCYGVFSFQRFDYFILKTEEALIPEKQPYKVEFMITNNFNTYDNGKMRKFFVKIVNIPNTKNK